MAKTKTPRRNRTDLETRVANLERIVAALPLAFSDLYLHASKFTDSLETTECALNGLVDELLFDAVTDRAFKEWNEGDAVAPPVASA